MLLAMAAGGQVLTGLDILAGRGFAPMVNKKVGLITNHTGIDRFGRSIIESMHGKLGDKLLALFSPEHGLQGMLDSKVPSSVHEETGLPIHSLYGETRRPTHEMLEGIEVLVFDIQDIGTRFYTYITTMAYAMEEAAKRGIEFIVLDRPNPINGLAVEGPVLDKKLLSFIGYYPMPLRHGMTVGELALMFNSENRIGCRLEVIKMEGWSRKLWFDQTGLPWVNPSPNMRSLTEAMLYPCVGTLEGTNISVGRGTDTPFELLGAPWIDGIKLAAMLNARRLPGVTFVPVRFKPEASVYQGELCGGINLIVLDRNAFRPVATAVEIASALYRLYPNIFQIDRALSHIGQSWVIERIKRGDDPRQIAAAWEPEVRAFIKLRSKYLLYD